MEFECDCNCAWKLDENYWELADIKDSILAVEAIINQVPKLTVYNYQLYHHYLYAVEEVRVLNVGRKSISRFDVFKEAQDREAVVVLIEFRRLFL